MPVYNTDNIAKRKWENDSDMGGQWIMFEMDLHEPANY